MDTRGDGGITVATFPEEAMNKVRLLTVLVVTLGILVIVLGAFLFSGEAESRALPGLAADEIPAGLGIVYLPVTQGVSEYYRLGVEHGALVTEVTPGSLAEQAGVRAGDVILSFNGVTPQEKDSLLGMMMSCQVGETVTLEVWRQDRVQTMEFMHWQR